MRASGRLGCLALAVGGMGFGLAPPAGAQASDQQITAFWSQAELTGAGGPADVVEVIDWDFGDEPGMHGIIREVPGLPPDAPIEVSSPDASDTAEVSEGEAGANIRIGDPDAVVTGPQRYRIAYPFSALLDGDRVEWQAIGNDFDVPIGRAEIHLVAPVALGDVECAAGTEGRASVACEVREEAPGHVVVTAQGLGPAEGVVVVATLGEELDQAPTPATPPGDDDAPADETAGTETAATTEDEGGGSTSLLIILGGAVVMLGAAVAIAVPRGRRR